MMQLVTGVAKMTTICYSWQVQKLPYMEVLNILPITRGHTVHGALHCSWYSIAPTTIVCKCS